MYPIPSQCLRALQTLTNLALQSQNLLSAIKEYENNKWKVIGQKVGKPAKACEQHAKEHWPGKLSADRSSNSTIADIVSFQTSFLKPRGARNDCQRSPAESEGHPRHTKSFQNKQPLTFGYHQGQGAPPAWSRS